MTEIVKQSEKIIEQLDMEIKNENESINRFKTKTLNEIIQADYGKEEWLIDKLFPLDTISVISGSPSNFKTWITMAIANSLVSGSLFLNKFEVLKSSVLFVDEENNLRTIQKRGRAFGINADDNFQIHYLNQIGFKIDKEEDLNHLIEVVKQKNIKLVIFDSLVRIHRGEENSSRDMAKVLEGLQKIRVTGTSIIFTHHHRKESSGYNNPSQSLRGSSDILAGVDVHIAVKLDKPNSCLYLEQTKLRQDEAVPSFKVKISKNENGLMELSYDGEDKRQKEKQEMAIIEISDLLKTKLESIDILQIKDELPNKYSQNMVKQVLDNLLSEGIIAVTKAQHNRYLYSWNQIT